MLIKFSVKNFKSIKEKATLDMRASSIKEYSDHVVVMAKEKLLPVAAIYGANASGKSNVIEALYTMGIYILYSFNFGGDEKDSVKNPKSLIEYIPFLFDKDTATMPTIFEIYFSDEIDMIYQYGFSYTKEAVEEEWLYSKSKGVRDYKKIFYRNRAENVLDLEKISEKQQENIKVSLEKETLIVSLGSKLKIPMLKKIRDFFLYNIEIINFANSCRTDKMLRSVPAEFIESKEEQKEVVEYLAKFDDSIKDFKITKNKKEDSEDYYYRIEAMHATAGSDELTPLLLNYESAGTQKMFAMYEYLKMVIERGGVLAMDELNSRLHPLLVRCIIQLFLDPEVNKKHAQLIFTTHDVWTLDSGILRRDEIWFTEKSETGDTELYSLDDVQDENGVKIRFDENFLKNYMLGRYGAVPRLKPFFKIVKGHR